jgi:hypothetical protein
MNQATERHCKHCNYLNDQFDLKKSPDSCTRCAIMFDKPAPGSDNVNHPAHYTNGSIECIDAIRAALTPEEFRGYCKGNAIKYVWRERLKGGNESMAKAGWYLNEAQK